MVDKERRNQIKPVANRLLRQLNDAQRLTLASLERFGWELKFIRHPLFLPMVPVVRDPGRQNFATLQDDGSLTESAALKLGE